MTRFCVCIFITVSSQTCKFLLNISCFISLSRESIVANLDQQVSGNVDINNHTFVIVAASIYYLEQNYDSALRILNEADHLEWWVPFTVLMCILYFCHVLSYYCLYVLGDYFLVFYHFIVLRYPCKSTWKWIGWIWHGRNLNQCRKRMMMQH